MKTKAFLQTAGVVSLAGLLAACSPTSDSAAPSGGSTAVAVKGEPIRPLQTAPTEVRGEPIRPLPQTDSPPATTAVATAGPAGITEPPASSTSAGDEGASAFEAVADVRPEAGAEARLNTPVIQSEGRDYLSVGFDQLAGFNFEMTDELLEAKGDPEEITMKTNGQIPPRLRALNQKEVAVKGYMLPLKVEEGAVTEFLLMRDQSMCCFGTVPKINEWVSVKTIGRGVKPVMDEPVTIFGRLHIGELRENGYLVGIYRMDGEKLAGALDL